jgi:hypothetical protein
VARTLKSIAVQTISLPQEAPGAIAIHRPAHSLAGDHPHLEISSPFEGPEREEMTHGARAGVEDQPKLAAAPELEVGGKPLTG